METEDKVVFEPIDIRRAVEVARDPDLLAQAYVRVFGSVEGRAVLFDLMSQASILEIRPYDMPALERAARDGMAGLVAIIIDRTGVDAIERVATLSVVAQQDQIMERAHGSEYPGVGSAEPNRSDLDGATDPFEDD